MLLLFSGAQSLVLVEKSVAFSSPLVRRRQAPQALASGRDCLFQPPWLWFSGRLSYGVISAVLMLLNCGAGEDS